MFPPAPDSTCEWIVRSEREVPHAIHTRWKGVWSVWSAFPTPSTNLPLYRTGRRVPRVEESS